MLRAPSQTWGQELNSYEHEKRHAVDERLLQGPPARLAKGHIQKQDRVFDPLLQRFRDPGAEAGRHHQEAKGAISHLNRAQDIQIMREQPFNILTHESKLEALAPGKDPTLINSSKRMPKGQNPGIMPVKDFHILSNLPLAEHHWARPEDRPPVKEVKTEPRKLHAHLVKDFNIVTNRYLDNHDAKEGQAKHLSLLDSTQKYMRQNRFDPLTQQFADPRHEELVRAADHAREVEVVLRAQQQVPPTFKGRQSVHYGIISHDVHNEDAIRMWDQLEDERTDRYKARYIAEHNAAAQEVKETSTTKSRRLNRIAPERFQEPKRRGYDIIDNYDYGQGPKEKYLHDAFTKPRMTPWEKATDGKGTATPAPQQHSQRHPPETWQPPSQPSSKPASSSSTPALQATLRLPAPAEAEGRRLSPSSSAQQLRTPSVRSATGMSAASGGSSLRRSELRRCESMGASFGAGRHTPAPPGQTRPVGRTPPPAPSIPGDNIGAVYAQPRF